MKKFDVDFAMKIQVSFSNPKKALEFFLESDWKKTFFTFSDLEEVSIHVAHGFYEESTRFKDGVVSKWIEGFDLFIKQKDDCMWVSSFEEYGEIIVEVTESFDIDYCTEVD